VLFFPNPWDNPSQTLGTTLPRPLGQSFPYPWDNLSHTPGTNLPIPLGMCIKDFSHTKFKIIFCDTKLRVYTVNVNNSIKIISDMAVLEEMVTKSTFADIYISYFMLCNRYWWFSAVNQCPRLFRPCER
jgi:hypothetical protein